MIFINLLGSVSFAQTSSEQESIYISEKVKKTLNSLSGETISVYQKTALKLYKKKKLNDATIVFWVGYYSMLQNIFCHEASVELMFEGLDRDLFIQVNIEHFDKLNAGNYHLHELVDASARWVKQQTVNTACIDDGDKIYEEATVAILERLTF